MSSILVNEELKIFVHVDQLLQKVDLSQVNIQRVCMRESLRHKINVGTDILKSILQVDLRRVVIWCCWLCRLFVVATATDLFMHVRM